MEEMAKKSDLDRAFSMMDEFKRQESELRQMMKEEKKELKELNLLVEKFPEKYDPMFKAQEESLSKQMDRNKSQMMDLNRQFEQLNHRMLEMADKFVKDLDSMQKFVKNDYEDYKKALNEPMKVFTEKLMVKEEKWEDVNKSLELFEQRLDKLSVHIRELKAHVGV